MKNKVIFVCMLLTMCILGTSVFGASSINVNSSNVYVNDTITVTATVSQVASWSMKITASGPVTYVSGTTASANATEDGNNGSMTITAVFKATGDGIITFNLKGDSTTENKVFEEFSKFQKVTVTTKQVTPPPTIPEVPDNGNNNNNNNTSTTKSSNNYLSSLLVDQEGLSPRFLNTKMNYTITVPESVNTLNITARAADSKAKVSVRGNTGLKVGDNIITITVTAENGYTRTYKIIATKTNDPDKANAYLENLVIENISLKPEFSSEELEYDLGEIESNITKLNILAYAKIEEAKIEILGNENLAEGENTIIVKVTAKDGTTTKEYILKVNKKASEQVNIYEDVSNLISTDKNSGIKNTFSDMYKWFVNNGLVLLLFTLCIIEFVQIVYLYNKVNDNILIKIFSGNNITKKDIIEKNSSCKDFKENLDIETSDEKIPDEQKFKIDEEEEKNILRNIISKNSEENDNSRRRKNLNDEK